MTKNSITRKCFLSGTFLFSTSLIGSPFRLLSLPQEKPPAIDAKIVNEFVKIAHNDFNLLKEMLLEYPLLLNAAWDWGGGDFETAIGAAGHMGLIETATYLLSKGARADLFVLTMLGKTDIVKSILVEFPSLLNASGPHGFTLLHHAEKGGKASSELFDHLQILGLTVKHRKLY